MLITEEDIILSFDEGVGGVSRGRPHILFLALFPVITLLSYGCLLAPERAVFVVDRKRHFVRPALLVVVAAEPELVSATGDIVNKDVSRALVSGTIAPADGVFRFIDDFVGAGVDVA